MWFLGWGHRTAYTRVLKAKKSFEFVLSQLQALGILFSYPLFVAL